MADGPDKWRPQTHETADHSIPYSAGLALMYGKIDPDYYEDPYLHDARLLDLVSRIKCLPSDEADKPELANLCELEIVLKSGVAQDGTRRISPRTFQQPDDRCRNGREVPPDGAKALAC